MRLTLLGTGCPQCSPQRMGPASLVRHGTAAFLVDCGSGVGQRLVSADSSGAALDAVFLTHLHSDHVVDFYQLVISAWHQGRDRPQRVFGPPGTRRFVERTMAVWEDERAGRIDFEKRASARGLEVEVVEFGDGVVFDEGGLSVEAVEVDHKPVPHAYGFIFRAAGHSLAFSGDTRYCPPFLEAARGADVLVHEVFLPGEMPTTGHGRSEEGIRNVMSYHTPSSEVGKAASAAAAGVLVLNHFVPVAFDAERLLQEVRADFAGPVIVGEDLMDIDLDTGFVTHASGHFALTHQKGELP